MVGAVLTQNTAWNNVERAIAALKAAQVLSVASILALPSSELAALIRPAGYFNVKTRRLKALCKFLHTRGVAEDPEQLARQAPLPELRQQLLGVHGVGAETADSILLYALGKPIFVVDAYTRRIFVRLGHLASDAGYGPTQHLFHANLPTETALFNEYHALIVALGKTHCRSKPICTPRHATLSSTAKTGHCPLFDVCPHAQNLPPR